MVRRWRPQKVGEVVAAVAGKSVKTGKKRAKNRLENKSKNMTTAEVAETVKIDAMNLIDVVQDLCTLEALVPVSTAYKRKKDKVRPLDQPTNGEGTGGDPHFLDKCEEREKQEGRHTPGRHFDLWITLKFSDIPHGSRLTKERKAEMDIGSELWPREKELLLALLFNRESAIAFDWQEKGRIRPKIEHPHVIRIRPDHIP